MRYVCPKDVKKMLLQQVRSTGRGGQQKHKYEGLKEGIWLEPALPLMRKKTKEEWTEKHRNVVRKLFLEGGWVQQRYRKAQAPPLSRMARSHTGDWKWQRGVVTHPLSDSQWNGCSFSVRKWESEKHKSLGIPAEGSDGRWG